MYLQMAGLVFMPTATIVYVINYVDLDRQHLAQELDERYEHFIHWGEVPDDFDYRAPYRHQFRDGVVSAAPPAPSYVDGAADGPDVPDLPDYRLHYRRLRLMDRVYASLRHQRLALVAGQLPLQDRVLDLVHTECTAGSLDAEGAPTSRPLLRAMAGAWGVSLTAAAKRVLMEHADRQHALVQTELHRLRVETEVRAARTHADLDRLVARYGDHD